MFMMAKKRLIKGAFDGLKEIFLIEWSVDINLFV